MNLVCRTAGWVPVDVIDDTDESARATDLVDAERQRERQITKAGFYMNRARTRYQALFDRYQTDGPDADTSEDVYRHAAFRIGLAWQQLDQPNYVRALFAFLRARQNFQNNKLDPTLMVHIARCYAQLAADGQTHDELFEYLKGDYASDSRPPGQQLAQLLDDLQTGLSGYRGSEKSKILFYIAQGQYRAALRDPINGQARMAGVVHTYQRLVGPDADVDAVEPDLAIAARLGWPRAAFKAGDAQRAERVLKDLMADTTGDVSNQDRAMAATMLADHYRDHGRFQDALERYKASLEYFDQ